MSLTFKKQSSGNAFQTPRETTDIKLNKKEIGLINGPYSLGNGDKEFFTIRLTVKNPDYQNLLKEDRNCPFKWIQLKVRPESENAARIFLKENWKKISEKYEIIAY